MKRIGLLLLTIATFIPLMILSLISPKYWAIYMAYLTRKGMKYILNNGEENKI